MNDFNLKALYFCHTHSNLFSQKNCNVCGRGMCHTCIHRNSNCCPSCIKDLKKSKQGYLLKNEVLITIGIALLASLIFHYYQFHHTDKLYNSFEFLPDLSLVFLYSLSAVGSVYMMRTHSFIDDIKSIPFIGFKLALIVLLLTIASCIPVLYILYNAFFVIRDTLMGE